MKRTTERSHHPHRDQNRAGVSELNAGHYLIWLRKQKKLKTPAGTAGLFDLSSIGHTRDGISVSTTFPVSGVKRLGSGYQFRLNETLIGDLQSGCPLLYI